MNECIQYSVAQSPDTTAYRASFLFLSCSVQLSTIEQRFNCKLHSIETGIVMSWYLALSWHRDMSRPFWYWYQNIGTHDTCRGIMGLTQH